MKQTSSYRCARLSLAMEGYRSFPGGRPGPTTVEPDHPGERSEPAEEQLGDGILPVGVERAEASGRHDQIDGSGTDAAAATTADVGTRIVCPATRLPLLSRLAFGL